MVAGRGVVGKRKKEEEEAVTREITEWRCGTIGFFLLVCFDRGGITSEIQMTRGRGIAETWKNRWTNVEGGGKRKAR